MRLAILVATKIEQAGRDGIVVAVKPIHEVGIHPEIGIRAAYPPSLDQSKGIRGIAQSENLPDKRLELIDGDIEEKVGVGAGKPGYHGQRILPRQPACGLPKHEDASVTVGFRVP